MSTNTKPTVPEAIDLMESWTIDGRYNKQGAERLVQAIRIILDELTRVQTELNRAAGEIVVLREQVKCAGCGKPMEGCGSCPECA